MIITDVIEKLNAKRFIYADFLQGKIGVPKLMLAQISKNVKESTPSLNKIDFVIVSPNEIADPFANPDQNTMAILAVSGKFYLYAIGEDKIAKLEKSLEKKGSNAVGLPLSTLYILPDNMAVTDEIDVNS